MPILATRAPLPHPVIRREILDTLRDEAIRRGINDNRPHLTLMGYAGTFGVGHLFTARLNSRRPPLYVPVTREEAISAMADTLSTPVFVLTIPEHSDRRWIDYRNTVPEMLEPLIPVPLNSEARRRRDQFLENRKFKGTWHQRAFRVYEPVRANREGAIQVSRQVNHLNSFDGAEAIAHVRVFHRLEVPSA